jgi:hypothetical protein
MKHLKEICFVLALLVMSATAHGQQHPTLTITPHPDFPNNSELIMSAIAFQNAFTSETQCKGIDLLATDGVHPRKADFALPIFANDHDKADPQWVWLMAWATDPSAPNSKNHGTGGLGTRPVLEDSVRDVCLTIWDDLHRPYPGQNGGSVR